MMQPNMAVRAAGHLLHFHPTSTTATATSARTNGEQRMANGERRTANGERRTNEQRTNEGASK